MENHRLERRGDEYIYYIIDGGSDATRSVCSGESTEESSHDEDVKAQSEKAFAAGETTWRLLYRLERPQRTGTFRLNSCFFSILFWTFLQCINTDYVTRLEGILTCSCLFHRWNHEFIMVWKETEPDQINCNNLNSTETLMLGSLPTVCSCDQSHRRHLVYLFQVLKALLALLNR